MITILLHRDGQTRRVDAVDPAWLVPEAREKIWVDIELPEPAARDLLQQTFKLHELSLEDALSAIHHPKIELFDQYLYLILHGIQAGAGGQGFSTNDIDFFLGAQFLVTVHTAPSRSIEQEQQLCLRNANALGEGPAGLLHRIVDAVVDHYRPEVDALEERLDLLEDRVFENPGENPVREILSLKRDVSSLRRVALPQRDAVGRLARREFTLIPDAMAYRFRDVYDHLVQMTDEAIFFQDRVTGLLDAYLSSQSNRLNQVMKVLTVMSTIFMPLTVLTGLFGMNVPIPHLPGPPAAQFWWIVGICAVTMIGMLGAFRWKNWL
ncbi:MAG: magnesium transporter CorA family protein [Vicinamibacterales bacterium]